MCEQQKKLKLAYNNTKTHLLIIISLHHAVYYHNYVCKKNTYNYNSHNFFLPNTKLILAHLLTCPLSNCLSKAITYISHFSKVYEPKSLCRLTCWDRTYISSCGKKLHLPHLCQYATATQYPH